jgi:hypothetical protein
MIINLTYHLPISVIDLYAAVVVATTNSDD